MQGTVREFSSTTASGTVLLDDGTVLPFDHRAFDGSGLRLLRFGQRVRFEVVEDDEGRRLASISLVTLDVR